MKLNEAQLRAVHHVSGPGICLAGPGSGKTAVITRRVLHLVRDKGIPPGSILVITFTKAAAVEMKSRYERLLYEQCPGSEPRGTVNFGTFHAFFFKILKQAYHLDASSIIRENEALKIVSDILDDLAIDVVDRAGLVFDVKNEISKCKNSRVDMEKYLSASIDSDYFRKVYQRYGEELKRRRLIDFEDMIRETERLLTERPDILGVLREKYRYIMIDEFQDVNRQQYEIVRLLAAPLNNLFIVGDDDQAIYGFRGSEPGIMLGFKEDYPGAAEFFLNVNYRSKGSIVEAAGRVISHNTHRFPKDIETVHEKGQPVRVLAFDSRAAEVEAVADMIMEDYRRGLSFSQMAVITRTNGEAALLPGVFTQMGIRFCMKEGVQDLYAHPACRDVLGYIRVARGDMRRDAVLGIVNRPVRYLSRNMFDEAVVDLERVKGRLKEKQWAVRAIEQLEFDLGMIRRASPFSAVMYVRRAVGYDDFLRETCERTGKRSDDALEALEALMNEARRFSDMEEWFGHISRVQQELHRQRQVDRGVPKEGVTVTTMHGSKGLEYDSVYIIGAVEGITPYFMAESQEEIAEERRMFYVAMTRARMKLTVTWFRDRAGFRVRRSRFLKEMGEP